ncbi:cystathionine beta-synthase [Roseateles noduli]|nr:cystathionine beta-synthase [Roseateles noduli]
MSAKETSSTPVQQRPDRVVERPAVLDLIGNTPLVPVHRLDTGPCQLFLKLESQNPGGSIKDRIGLSMIEAAERDGLLPPGGTVVEATAGNTGLGLALVARAKGYRVVLVVPDKMSAEKVLQLKALGAEVHITRSDVGKGHPDYYQDRAARLVQDIPGAWYADQFNNPNNPLAHETTTGPEIWQQVGHRIDALVCGVGSGGTITGLSRFFAKVRPGLDVVLADPAGSILKDFIETGSFGEAGSWAVEGIGEDFIPPIADLSGVRHAYSITDEESFATARDLYRAEGILAGSSTGTLLAAALKYCRAQTTPKRVVTLVCDTGTRYLSKVYNDPWMFDQGLLKRATKGDLRDLIARLPEDGAVISVSPEDTLATAFSRMRQAEVSQLPVLKDGKLVGLLDESDLLAQMHMDARHFKDSVDSAMSHDVQTLPPGAPLSDLIAQLRKGLVAVIADDHAFHGLVTRFDLLNHLRKGLS